MDNAPERIWLDWPAANRGDVVYDEPPERETQPGQTGYIRADLYTALQTRLAEVEEGRQSLFDLWSREKAARFDAETRAEAAEARLAEVEAERDEAHKARRELVLEVLAASGQAQEAYEAQRAAEAALAAARADALREAASVFDELWRENDAVKKAAILALIENPEPTK